MPETATCDDLLDIVRDIVRDDFGTDTAEEIDADTPLLTTGLLTSLSLVELQTRIDERLGATLDPTALGYDNGDTVRQLFAALDGR